MNDSTVPRRGKLTDVVVAEIASRIDAGIYGLGGKLPSEQDLGKELGVSRTVVREAIASLRLSGRLVSRQGVGVFVSNDVFKQVNLSVDAPIDLKGAAQVLELRLAVELEAVALAAQRRTHRNIALIAEAFDEFNKLDGSDREKMAIADFRFHVAISEATNNPQFPQFMDALGAEIILDLSLAYRKYTSVDDWSAHIKKIAQEHGEILSAISQGDSSRARKAIKLHLKNNMLRYEHLLGKK